MDYNEQFRWEEAGAIQEWYRAGLLRGLPYPVLSVAEHFAAEHEGFEWGAKYRAAGYTTTTLLWYDIITYNRGVDMYYYKPVITYTWNHIVLQMFRLVGRVIYQ